MTWVLSKGTVWRRAKRAGRMYGRRLRPVREADWRVRCMPTFFFFMDLYGPLRKEEEKQLLHPFSLRRIIAWAEPNAPLLPLPPDDFLYGALLNERGRRCCFFFNHKGIIFVGKIRPPWVCLVFHFRFVFSLLSPSLDSVSMPCKKWDVLCFSL